MAFTKLFQDGFRLFDGSFLNRIFNGQVVVPSLNILSETVTAAITPVGGSITMAPQNLTATGTTQLGAALISSALAIITVSTTASTHGVRLPSAATGLQVKVGNHGTFGVKVYPFAGDKIGAASTNAADTTVLAINKMNTYQAIDSVNWVVERGA